jgi:hypothetical protein
VALSLCRLWHQQGRRDAAYQVLAETYDRFTEGFDTADVQQARAMLTTLESCPRAGEAAMAKAPCKHPPSCPYSVGFL